MSAVTWRREKDGALWVMGSKVNTSVMAWRIRTMGSSSFVLVCWWFQLGICTLKEDRVGNILKVDFHILHSALFHDHVLIPQLSHGCPCFTCPFT